ncbi:UDP-N-acetylglucosamine 2-epimerase [Desulfonema ishimotonii]|uniref:UDP-N-acetylglucosamine 2-epimerase n=1 Tax=Desulfonema ishimotonii TaxID=45657 RepID=A0A401FVF2_9BACT|nr:UDP-N-acetylglucosamine 2-epimerase (non-hydrolyzing) [Desulfonema ishimotonii]GBC60939.1 UDP-N-acetylglucosamine 2-epimerase [Desulfonema ishimotonii]
MKIVTVVGARPQFIKAAVVSRAIVANGQDVSEVIVHTGQHYDRNMSQVFFDQLEIPEPRYHLEVGSGSHGEMTGTMLAKVENVLMEEQPDGVLVYGDTNSTLAGALAASKLDIPVAHVEAGLRSFNRQMPEEINRVLTDHVADLLFCPTDAAVSNLNREGITRNVRRVGDVMYDAFLYYRALAEEKSEMPGALELTQGRYKLATIHRQENTDDPEKLRNIFSALGELAEAASPVVMPVHPRTRKLLRQHQRDVSLSPHLRMIPPLDYLDMIALENSAQAILTDSGGVQKEAYFAGVPCITLRAETEWVETVAAGWNCLGGSDTCQIVAAFEQTVAGRPETRPRFYGDGEAGKRIVREMLTRLCR